MTHKQEAPATHRDNSHYFGNNINDLWDKREALIDLKRRLEGEIEIINRLVFEVEEGIFDAQDIAMIKIGSQWR